MRFRRLSVLLVLLAFSGTALWAQDTGTAGGAGDIPEGLDFSTPDEPEFPQWARDLRRGEIIFFGSLPFSALFSGLGYRTGKYLWNYAGADSVDAVPGWNEIDSGDNLAILGITLGLSLSIAVTDFILGKIQEKRHD